MAEKTEEQIAKEKAAVLAMKNAQSNMGAAIARIEDLERGLRGAINVIGQLKGYISPSVYTYPSNGNSQTCHAAADDAIARIAKTLG